MIFIQFFKDLKLSLIRHRFQDIGRDRVRQEQEQFRGVQIWQRFAQTRDFGRLQAGDPAMVTRTLTDREWVTTEKLNLLPVGLLVVSGSTEQSSTQPVKERAGAAIDGGQPQLPILFVQS